MPTNTSGLRGAADSAGDLRVSLDEIYRYTCARAPETTATSLVLQQPTFSFDLTGQREGGLTSLDRGERDGALRFDLAGDDLIFDKHGREVGDDLCSRSTRAGTWCAVARPRRCGKGW